jgi:hypothetical protein
MGPPTLSFRKVLHTEPVRVGGNSTHSFARHGVHVKPYEGFQKNLGRPKF